MFDSVLSHPFTIGFSFQVESRDSCRQVTSSEFAAEAEGQSTMSEEAGKVPKRTRERPRDRGSTMIYLKAIQGILGTSLPSRKGEAAPRARTDPGERGSRAAGPARTIPREREEKVQEPTRVGRTEGDPVRPSWGSDTRVVIDPHREEEEEEEDEEEEEEPQRELHVTSQRTPSPVLDSLCPPLHFQEEADCQESQKVSLPGCGLAALESRVCSGLSGPENMGVSGTASVEPWLLPRT